MKTCLVDDCVRKARSRGYCPRHYARWLKYGDPLKGVISPHGSQTGECSVADCTSSKVCKGYCNKHYLKFKKYGDPMHVEKKPASEHHRATTKQGYVLVSGYPDHPNSQVNGRILEHILVMSEHLGRALLEHENVHHKNGVRDDNKLENLELWSKSQPAGQRVEDKVEWALQIIQLYKPEYLNEAVIRL